VYACAVCHCKTIFPSVGPTKLQNNVSKMLIVKKSDSYCLQLSDTETSDNEKNDVISKKLHFHFLGDRPTQNLTG